MDEQTYKLWWALHLRSAQGEALSGDDQVVYDAGCVELDAEEQQASRSRDLEVIRDLKTRIIALEKENADLLKSKSALDSEVATLEAHLHPRTRQLLHLGNWQRLPS